MRWHCFRSRLPINYQDVFDKRKTFINDKNLIAWNFYHRDNPIDQIDIIITWELSQIETIAVEMNGQLIFIPKIEDLIRMKKSSGRPQDLEDIKALESKSIKK